MDFTLFSRRFIPAYKRAGAAQVTTRHYRVLRNGRLLGQVDASSPEAALAKLTRGARPRPTIRSIDGGAITEVNNNHYQAQEL